MSRKDYVLIAEALKQTKPPIDTVLHAQWYNTVHAITTRLQADNSRFNTLVFLKASGVTAAD